MAWGRSDAEQTLPVTSLQKEINGLFNDFLTGWETPWLRHAERSVVGFRPKVDVTEDEKEIRVCAELPGVKKEDVKVSLEGGVLTISGEKHNKMTEKGNNGKTMYLESSHGAFQRGFTFDAEIDEDKIQAAYNDGVLTITLPKSEKARERAKTISIK
jgi:HSP20 family protein